MRIGSKKWVLFKFVPYEYKALEKYLEKMALKGWMLEGMVGYFLKFTKIESKALKYSVDVMDKISMFVGSDSKSAVECREYCEAAGWKFICQMEKMQIYCNDNGIDNIPIQTDEEEKYKSIFRASFKYCIVNIMLVSMFVYSQYLTTFGSAFSEFLADNSRLILLLVLGLWFVQEITQFIHFIIWSIRGRDRLKHNEEISYDFKIITNIKLIFNKILFMLSIVMLLLLIISGLLGKHTVKFILVLLISTLVGILISKLVKKSNYNDSIRKFINIFSIVIIVMVDLMIFSRMTITIGVSGTLEANNSDINYVLNLEDFNANSGDIYCDKDSSVLATVEHYLEEDDDSYISYYLYKSKYDFIIDYIADKEFNKVDKYDDEKVINVESNIAENIKVYENVNKNKFILVSDNIFISLYIDKKGMDDKEVIKIIYDKVFKSAS